MLGVGVDALRHVSEPKQIALAALPLLFGLHQLSEAFVWWGLQGHVPNSVERVALWIWLLFAFVTLPVLLPVAVDLVERSKTRRLLIGAFAGLGFGSEAHPSARFRRARGRRSRFEQEDHSSGYVR